MAPLTFFKCDICGGLAEIFARDNPFLIYKCENCGFVLLNRADGEVVKGGIKGERPVGSRVVKGFFVGEDGSEVEYYRTPNAPNGGSVLDVLFDAVEEALTELEGEK